MVYFEDGEFGEFPDGGREAFDRVLAQVQIRQLRQAFNLVCKEMILKYNSSTKWIQPFYPLKKAFSLLAQGLALVWVVLVVQDFYCWNIFFIGVSSLGWSLEK